MATQETPEKPPVVALIDRDTWLQPVRLPFKAFVEFSSEISKSLMQLEDEHAEPPQTLPFPRQ